ncbi:hypothetical protein HLB44_34970 [Aquincola sp. S2]|uniref:Uncharacterized protein n=1 Tax=Pseudaquabacterium terrae TaxID=2732868 RepID=A0ABX2EU09_9BURK|nr:hypothetical protein [Aquabacterium terrae]NRF72200.1 hypothetical protein [Aquabacterium terrae]
MSTGPQDRRWDRPEVVDVARAVTVVSPPDSMTQAARSAGRAERALIELADSAGY